jgi:adenosine deaminase
MKPSREFLSSLLLFQNLQDFLDMYYEACAVLQTEQDFYDLMYAYLRQATIDGVYVTEIFFDPQTHTERGVAFDTVINGLHHALIDGYLNFGIKGSLIMCFLRHLSEDSAVATLKEAMPHLDKLVAVGLDSGEVGNPPSKFKRVFKKAAKLGLKLVAHAGEEADPSYITEALDLLHVRRVDHGVRCLEDQAVLKNLVDKKIPLTTCPLSNKKLQVTSRFLSGRNVTKDLLREGVMVTINSDDPAYFGGYITQNFLVTAKEAGLSEKEVCQICRNSFNATFLPDTEKQYFQRRIDEFNVIMGCCPPPRSITFFGSRSPLAGSKEYEWCSRVAELFASRGFSIVNGGYNGLMEAASRGGASGAKHSTASNVEVKGVLAPRVFSGRHSTGNPFLTRIVMSRSINERIGKLVSASEYIFVSGGTIGTLTELLVAWNEAAVRPMHGGTTKKLYLLKSFWQETISRLMAAVGIYPEDCKLLTFVESAEEVVRLVEQDWDRRAAQGWSQNGTEDTQ